MSETEALGDVEAPTTASQEGLTKNAGDRSLDSDLKESDSEASIPEGKGQQGDVKLDEIKVEDMQKMENEGQGTEEDTRLDEVKDEDDQEKSGTETEEIQMSETDALGDVEAPTTANQEGLTKNAGDRSLDSDSKESDSGASISEGKGQQRDVKLDEIKVEDMQKMENEGQGTEEDTRLDEVKDEDDQEKSGTETEEFQMSETEALGDVEAPTTTSEDKLTKNSGQRSPDSDLNENGGGTSKPEGKGQQEDAKLDEIKVEDMQKMENDGQGVEEDTKLYEVKDEDDQEKRGTEMEGKEDIVEKCEYVRDEDGKENDLQKGDKKAVESEEIKDVKDDEKEAKVQEGEEQKVNQMRDTEVTKSMENEHNEENVHLGEVKEMNDVKHVSEEEDKGTEDKEKKYVEPKKYLNEDINSVKEEESKERENKNISYEKQKGSGEENGVGFGDKEINEDQAVKAEKGNMEKTEGEKKDGLKKSNYDNGQERTETTVQEAQEEDENKKGKKQKTAAQQEKVGKEDKLEIHTYETRRQKQGHAEQRDCTDEDKDIEDKVKEEQDQDEDKIEEDKDETHKEDTEKYGGEGGGMSRFEEEEAKSKQNGTKRKRSRGRRDAGKGEQLNENKSENIFRSPILSSSERPHRERKTVARLVETIERGPKKLNFRVEKGEGTPLKDIANVAFKLSMVKPENIHFLHQLLFGMKEKTAEYRNDLLLFSGFMWHGNEDKKRLQMREKLEKCVKEQLYDLCDIFDLPFSRTTTRKQDLVLKILEFIASPCAASDVLLAEKEQHSSKSTKRKRHSGGSAPKLKSSSEKRSRMRLVVGEDTPKMMECNTSGSEDEAGLKSEKEDSDGDHFKEDKDEKDSEREKENGSKEAEEDDEVEYSKEQKTKKAKRERSVRRVQSKKVTPAVKAVTPSRSAQKTSSGSSKELKKNEAGGKFFSRKKKDDDAPIIKSHSKSDSNAKPAGKIVRRDNAKNVEVGGPSNTELREKICEILKEVDFNTATFTDILKELIIHFKTDLIPRKEPIKLMIQDELIRLADAKEEDSEDDDKSAKDDNAGSARKGVEARS